LEKPAKQDFENGKSENAHRKICIKRIPSVFEKAQEQFPKVQNFVPLRSDPKKYKKKHLDEMAAEFRCRRIRHLLGKIS
jgi:hypothetical protein